MDDRSSFRYGASLLVGLGLGVSSATAAIGYYYESFPSWKRSSLSLSSHRSLSNQKEEQTDSEQTIQVSHRQQQRHEQTSSSILNQVRDSHSFWGIMAVSWLGIRQCQHHNTQQQQQQRQQSASSRRHHLPQQYGFDLDFLQLVSDIIFLAILASQRQWTGHATVSRKEVDDNNPNINDKQSKESNEENQRTKMQEYQHQQQHHQQKQHQNSPYPPTTSNNSHPDASASSKMHFFQQIQSNWGLITPKIQNVTSYQRSGEISSPNLSSDRVLPIQPIKSSSTIPQPTTQPTTTTSSVAAPTPASTGTVPSSSSSSSSPRYLEVLVHNVSHTDMILSLDVPQGYKGRTSTIHDFKFLKTNETIEGNVEDDDDDETDEKYCLCRPRFSAFEEYSRRVLESLSSLENADDDNNKKQPDLLDHLIYVPQYERSELDNRKIQRSNSLSILYSSHHPSNNSLPEMENDFGSVLGVEGQVPVGFALNENNNNTNQNNSHGRRPQQNKHNNNHTTERRNHVLAVSSEELKDLRIRGKDVHRVSDIMKTSPGNTNHEVLNFNAVFFPLLAMLLPQWHAKLQEKYAHLTFTSSTFPPMDNSNNININHNHQKGTMTTTPCKKVLILVSGVGTPRNWTHSIRGNSTQTCAQIMEQFIHALYPDVVVVQVYSDTNIFRYDENISFVQNELMPCIQAYRDAHAKGIPYPDEMAQQQPQNSAQNDDCPFDPDWRKTMSVTLSFADGSPARNHAIQAALRSYRPTYFHCWQLKTFWHESKIVYTDVEVHSFEEMETLPPIDTSSSELIEDRPLAYQVVQEMKAFKAQMQMILEDAGSNDIEKFWLRKTHKPVLAVLAVQMRDNGPVQFYRGTNMEVSMPTGSLCAERNVIGTALAENPALKRHHLKLIAVLSVPLPRKSNVITATTTLASSGEGSMSRQSSSGSLATLGAGSNNYPMATTSTTASARTSRSNSLVELSPATVGREKNTNSTGLLDGKKHSRLFSATNHMNTTLEDAGGWVLQDLGSATKYESTAIQTPSPVASIMNQPPHDRQIPLVSLGGDGAVVPFGSLSPTAPVRRIQLYQNYFDATAPSYPNLTKTNNTNQNHHHKHSQNNNSHSSLHPPVVGNKLKKRKKKTVVVSSMEDLNPLRPCGACNEWLKKIAETNPYFQILTFTDSDCNGVYCIPCGDE